MKNIKYILNLVIKAILFALISPLMSYAQEEDANFGAAEPYGMAWGRKKKKVKERIKEIKKERQTIQANSLIFKNDTNWPLKVTLYPTPKIGPKPHPSMGKGNPQEIDIPGPSTGRYPISGTFGQQRTKFNIALDPEVAKEFDQESLRELSKDIDFNWTKGQSFNKEFVLKKSNKTNQAMKDVVKLILYVEYMEADEGGTIKMSLMNP